MLSVLVVRDGGCAVGVEQVGFLGSAAHRTERLALETLNVCGIGSMASLQIEMLTDSVVE
jgi:hypothetical protein